MAFIIGLIISALSYIFQIYPRIFNKYFGVDVWSRTIEADYVKAAELNLNMKSLLFETETI
ncbi:hypothetical protein HYU45_02600 [Candidatus Daviesbacteria bacterium]|nr:hypothetical protein [Candidatus Daviesbacteria bacterium]